MHTALGEHMIGQKHDKMVLSGSTEMKANGIWSHSENIAFPRQATWALLVFLIVHVQLVLLLRLNGGLLSNRDRLDRVFTTMESCKVDI